MSTEKPASKYQVIPTSPTIAAGAAGIPAGVILVWVLQLLGVDPPPEVATSIGSILSALFALATKKGRR